MNPSRLIKVLLGSTSLGALALVFSFARASAAANEPAPVNPLNQLTEEEKASGWKLLFDGKTTQGWRGFNKREFPNKGWIIEEGSFRHLPKGGGGDIITADKFLNFDLEFEWRVSPGANSGVKYFIKESQGAPIGHEYQVIDDTRHEDAKRGPKWQTASLYDLLPPTNKVLRPVGEFNHSRILVQGNHVEHWLNGHKTLAYELDSNELKAAVANSKFKNVEGFGTKFKTSILLQDHGDEVWFRNLKIRELSANGPASGGSAVEIPSSDPSWRRLFDGKTLKGWQITDFAGHGEIEVQVDKSQIILGMGAALTGITWTNPLPKTNYEVTLEAKKMDGSDFFCGLTFPVGASFCSFIVGGWGGGVVGLSSIDSQDASQNETTKYQGFEQGRWYRIRVRVTPATIEGWIDQEKMVDVVTTGHQIALRFGEIELSKPFGIATWTTTAALRDIRIRELKAEAAEEKKKE